VYRADDRAFRRAILHGSAMTKNSEKKTEPKAEAKDRNLTQLESSLEQLEALVERLEGGELSLQQSLEEFERGIKLTRMCQTALKEAEQKVEILLKNTEDAEPVPFEGDS
jgi:exodeoxyribonuclease VII small subunit